MATNYDDAEALCPYFQYSQRKHIVCEGIIDGSNTRLEFDTQANRNKYRRRFCDSKYQKCEIHRMLERKYDDKVRK